MRIAKWEVPTIYFFLVEPSVGLLFKSAFVILITLITLKGTSQFHSV